MAVKVSLSNFTLLIGAIVLAFGFYLWYTQPIGTKLFQLSNDIIGSVFFVVALGIIIILAGTIMHVVEKVKK